MVLGLLFILSLAGNGVLAFRLKQQSTEVSMLKANPNAIADQQTKDLVEKVGKLIELPADETPTIATVNDPEKLKDQPFFAKAQVGQKVLIYTGAKKAILFDEAANKIIDVAPLTINAAATPEADATAKDTSSDE